MSKFHLVSAVGKSYSWWGFRISFVRGEISTTNLPDASGYQTCVFYYNNEQNSEVVQRYETLADAIEGHARWATKLGAKKAEMDLTGSYVVV